MVQWKRNSGFCISTINFCDLAGSERLKKTGNVGDRLKESNNINNSLLVLGRCIENIRAGQKMNKNKPIPFRESKLTRLFQKALMGSEDINIIITINPSLALFDESQHALNFASIAQEIVLVQKPVKLVRNRFSEMLENKRGMSPSTVQRVDPREDVERTEHYIELQRTVDQATAGFRNIWESRLKTVEENAKKEQQRLIDYYEEKIRDLQTDVIEISGSSSDEEECVKDLQSQMLQLREANNQLFIRNMQLEEQNAKLEEQLLAYQTLPLNGFQTDSIENSEEEGDFNHFR
nr:unnamed protein product [Callosobruchus analis]